MKLYRSLVLIIWACSGCTPQVDAPNYDPSSFINPHFQQGAKATQASEVSTQQWWQQLQDPVIDRLVDQAIQHNLDLKSASANIQESQALLQSAAGSRLPQVNLATSGERAFTGNSTGSSFSAGNNRLYTTTLLAGASVSWQSDLFGKLRNQQRASQARWQASQADYEALLHSVIADVIRQRVLLAITLQRIAIAKTIASSHQQTLASVERRYRQGVGTTSAVDLGLARENVYAAQATITGLEQDIAIAQHALDILLGQTPQTLLASEQPLAQLPLLDSQVAGIPMQLLDRRPDLRAAQLRTLADKADVSVALAALYPDLTISADIGWRDSEASGLFSPASLFGRLIGRFTQPLFNGGQLRADISAAKARYEAEAIGYTQDVLTAIQEVEDALIRNTKLHKQLAQITHQVNQARQAQRLSNGRYQKGIETLLTLLEAQRRRQNAEDRLLQTTLDYWNARVDLYLAIGGSWLDANHLTVTAANTPQ